MQKLEDEQKLQQEYLKLQQENVNKKLEDELKLQQEYLNKKYEVLQANVSSGSRASGRRSERSSSSKVQAWLESNADQTKLNERSIQELRTSGDVHDAHGVSYLSARERRQQPTVHLKTPKQLNHSNTKNVNSQYNTDINDYFSTSLQKTHHIDHQEQMHTQYAPPQAYPQQGQPTEVQQLMTRSLFSRDLPHFSGRAEEWPLFVSTYDRTTKMCGITEDENIIRLQRALKGKALESVQHRLMFPSSASMVIDTLRMLYGRPEAIIFSLIDKIRSDSPPKAEKLSSMVDFAVSVQNLHAIMLASGLTVHLTNPMLVQELVDKLPATFKLDWAKYIHNTSANEVSLTTFEMWLSEIAKAVSRVSHVSFPPSNTANPIRHNRMLVHSVQGKSCPVCLTN